MPWMKAEQKMRVYKKQIMDAAGLWNDVNVTGRSRASHHVNGWDWTVYHSSGLA